MAEGRVTEHAKDQFSWKPLGGLNEVGMNCMLMRFGETVLPVDCGVLFADSNNFGIEAVFPDFKTLLETEKIENWLITHAHEDHIGAIPHLMMIAKKLGVKPPKFWAPPFAKALICEKLNDGRYAGISTYENLINAVELDKDIEIQGVKVRFIEVRHSTVDCSSLAFTAKIGDQTIRVFHSADLKIDFNEFEDGVRSLEIFNAFGGARPDLMFLDSTNADREGQSVSEREIIEPLKHLFSTSKQRIFVTLFSSNVYRMATLIHLAERNGRKVAIAGRSMQTAFRLAQQLGSFDKMPKFSSSTLVAPEVLATLPDDKQLVLCSGSQGEFRSVLSKVSQESHPEFVIHQGDIVLFSSKVIPGNEKAISKLVNNLMKIGARVLWSKRAVDAAGGPIHASGHGRRAELRSLLNFLKPKILFPVHGQRFQLEACAEMAREAALEWDVPLEVHIQENNDEVLFHFHEGSWVISGRNLGDPYENKFLRMDRFYTPSRDSFLAPRKRAALGGCISVMIESSGVMNIKLLGVYPEYLSDERPFSNLSEEIENVLRAAMKKSKISFHSEGAAAFLEEEVVRYVRRSVGTRPLAIVQIAG